MIGRLSRWLFWIVLLAAPVAAGLFRVWVHHDAVQSGYALSKEEARRSELQAVNEQLSVELAAERSPERLSRRAAKLSLSPPVPRQIFGQRLEGRQ